MTTKLASASSANRIEGKSKELLSRVLEELGEWLDEPQTAHRNEAGPVEGKPKHAGATHKNTMSAKEAAADTARRLKELF